MRMTKQRQLILNIFKEEKKPFSAEMIFDELPAGSMNLSTVYRTIEKLSDLGMISKSVINNTSYYYYTHGSHHHYLICLNCKQMIEVSCHLDTIINNVIKNDEFLITQHDLTFYGYCNNCRKDFS